MRLDRLDANPEQSGNFFCRLSFSDTLQNLPLSKRELVQFWINVSRLFFCRSYVRYLDPLPDSISNRNCELMCARRVENLLGPAPCQGKCTGSDHPLFSQEVLDLLLELTKPTRSQIDLEPGGTPVGPQAFKSALKGKIHSLPKPGDCSGNIYFPVRQEPLPMRHNLDVPFVDQSIHAWNRFA